MATIIFHSNEKFHELPDQLEINSKYLHMAYWMQFGLNSFWMWRLEKNVDYLSGKSVSTNIISTLYEFQPMQGEMIAVLFHGYQTN